MRDDTKNGRGRVLLALTNMDGNQWAELLGERRTVVTEPDGEADASIDYAVVWKPEAGLLARLPNLKAIFSIGAGVDHIMADETLPDIPVVRVVEENLSTHMAEYVCWRVLDHHRRGREYRELQAENEWRGLAQPVAGDVSVGIMGFGALGHLAAEKLLALGFAVNGWSRSAKRMHGVTSFTGDEGLDAFLAATDILVVLLPLTPQTTGIIDYALLSKLKRDGALGGPVLINAGRGGLQKESDIVRALDERMLKEASLDVFETEPLPLGSLLWAHPRIFITPHAAAESDPVHLVPPMLDQMDACDRGEKLKNVVDRQAGY